MKLVFAGTHPVCYGIVHRISTWFSLHLRHHALADRESSKENNILLVPPSIDQLFWEDVEPTVHAGRLAVSQELFDRCKLIVKTEEEFEDIERTMKKVAKSIRTLAVLLNPRFLVPFSS